MNVWFLSFVTLKWCCIVWIVVRRHTRTIMFLFVRFDYYYMVLTAFLLNTITLPIHVKISGSQGIVFFYSLILNIVRVDFVFYFETIFARKPIFSFATIQTTNNDSNIVHNVVLYFLFSFFVTHELLPLSAKSTVNTQMRLTKALHEKHGRCQKNMYRQVNVSVRLKCILMRGYVCGCSTRLRVRV